LRRNPFRAIPTTSKPPPCPSTNGAWSCNASLASNRETSTVHFLVLFAPPFAPGLDPSRPPLARGALCPRCLGPRCKSGGASTDFSSGGGEFLWGEAGVGIKIRNAVPSPSLRRRPQPRNSPQEHSFMTQPASRPSKWYFDIRIRNRNRSSFPPQPHPQPQLKTKIKIDRTMSRILPKRHKTTHNSTTTRQIPLKSISTES